MIKEGDIVRYSFDDAKITNNKWFDVIVNRRGIVLSFEGYDDMKLANGENIFLFANVVWFGKEGLYLEKEFIAKLETINENKN